MNLMTNHLVSLDLMKRILQEHQAISLYHLQSQKRKKRYCKELETSQINAKQVNTRTECDKPEVSKDIKGKIVTKDLNVNQDVYIQSLIKVISGVIKARNWRTVLTLTLMRTRVVYLSVESVKVRYFPRVNFAFPVLPSRSGSMDQERRGSSDSYIPDVFLGEESSQVRVENWLISAISAKPTHYIP
ncbi:hypothetical protein FQR65_LT02374 [Abscondita terminalis]|nr:hypothetical protein FQR65_LT02374 [Abscondita terminalis]